MGDEVYTKIKGQKMLDYSNVANIHGFKCPLCDFESNKFLVTGNKNIQAAVGHEQSPMITVFLMQVGAKVVTPGLIIIPDGKLNVGDVNTFVND